MKVVLTCMDLYQYLILFLAGPGIQYKIVPINNSHSPDTIIIYMLIHHITISTSAEHLHLFLVRIVVTVPLE